MSELPVEALIHEVEDTEGSNAGRVVCVTAGVFFLNGEPAGLDRLDGREAGVLADEAELTEAGVEFIAGDERAGSGEDVCELGDGACRVVRVICGDEYWVLWCGEFFLSVG